MLGLDPAVKFLAGIILNDSEIAESFLIMKKSTLDETLLFFYTSLLTIDCDVVWCEDITYVRNYKSLIHMSEVLGMLRLVFAQRNIPFHVVNNMSWKKIIVGSGRADKDMIKKRAIELGAPIGLKQDLYDAWCIAEYGVKELNNDPKS